MEQWFRALGLNLVPSSLLGLFVALICLRSIAGYAYQVAVGRLHYGFLDHIRQRYHAAVTEACWTYLVRQEPAHFSYALTAQSETVAYGVVSATALANALLGLGVGILVALFISFRLTILAIGVGISIALPLAWFDIRFYRLAKTSLGAISHLFEQLGRNLGNLKFFKVRAAEASLEREFASVSSAYVGALIDSTRVSAKANLLHETGAAVVLAVLIYLALSAGAASGLEPIALTIIFARLIPRVNQVQTSIRHLLGILPQFALLQEQLESLARHPDLPTPMLGKAPTLARSLRFEAVSFRYANRSDRDALSNVSFEIPAGTALGILGLTGAGKTTLVDLAAGLITPTAGTVLLDGDALGEQAVAWRRSVSYVLQDDPLVNDTILANLRLGQADATEDEAWSALALAKADELVRGLPDGLKTRVGDRGSGLSRGQRQRICLARGLIRRPKLLILDEGTSALNPIDETALAGAFRSLLPNVTVLIVSHRLSAIQWVDRVIVLADGALCEQGSLRELEQQPDSLVSRMRAGEQSGLSPWTQSCSRQALEFSLKALIAQCRCQKKTCFATIVCMMDALEGSDPAQTREHCRRISGQRPRI